MRPDENRPYAVFDYTPTREASGPKAFLDGFRGYLQADAYQGYDALFASGEIVEVGCWAHARRYYYNARDKDPARAEVALSAIRRLFEIEKSAKDLSADERKELRERESKPILDRFRRWIDAEAPGALPKSPMGEAFGYTSNQWQALTRYLEDGRLDIDNNASERELRRVAVGRKNWLFAGSDAGGTRAAVLYSLVATCRRHEIDPFEYLRDVIDRVSTHPMGRIEELLPDRWKRLRQAEPTNAPLPQHAAAGSPAPPGKQLASP